MNKYSLKFRVFKAIVKLLRDIIGYLLGMVLFVGLMPALMWLASCYD